LSLEVDNFHCAIPVTRPKLPRAVHHDDSIGPGYSTTDISNKPRGLKEESVVVGIENIDVPADGRRRSLPLSPCEGVEQLRHFRFLL